MKINNANALNFNYLLIEYYKELGFTEDEVAVILMMDHLKSQGNDILSSDIIAEKMTFDKVKIDIIMNSLYKRKLIVLDLNAQVPSFSIEPIQEKVFERFQKNIFSDDEIQKNKEYENAKAEIYDELCKLFGRSLSPLETNRIDDWVLSGTPQYLILEAIKDAKIQQCYNISQVDKILLKKIREEDNFGNTII